MIVVWRLHVKYVLHGVYSKWSSKYCQHIYNKVEHKVIPVYQNGKEQEHIAGYTFKIVCIGWYFCGGCYWKE